MNRAELRRKAEAATHGEWKIELGVDTDGLDEVHGIYSLDSEECHTRIIEADGGVYPPYLNDAEFIVAAQPSVVIALLDELEKAEKERDELARHKNNLLNDIDDYLEERDTLLADWREMYITLMMFQVTTNSKVIKRTLDELKYREPT